MPDPATRAFFSGKYFWVQAETFAAAALLYKATGNASYVERYTHVWQYAWEHWVDHKFGAWLAFNQSRDNKLLSQQKAIPGAKCDYHPLAACITALQAFA